MSSRLLQVSYYLILVYIVELHYKYIKFMKIQLHTFKLFNKNSVIELPCSYLGQSQFLQVPCSMSLLLQAMSDFSVHTILYP